MPKPKPQVETERVITPLPRPLITEIDDYRFSNRLPSRSEAIRQLLREGLKVVGPEARRPGSGAERDG